MHILIRIVRELSRHIVEPSRRMRSHVPLFDWGKRYTHYLRRLLIESQGSSPKCLRFLAYFPQIRGCNPHLGNNEGIIHGEVLTYTLTYGRSRFASRNANPSFTKSGIIYGNTHHQRAVMIPMASVVEV